MGSRRRCGRRRAHSTDTARCAGGRSYTSRLASGHVDVLASVFTHLFVPDIAGLAGKTGSACVMGLASSTCAWAARWALMMMHRGCRCGKQWVISEEYGCKFVVVHRAPSTHHHHSHSPITEPAAPPPPHAAAHVLAFLAPAFPTRHPRHRPLKTVSFAHLLPSQTHHRYPSPHTPRQTFAETRHTSTQVHRSFKTTERYRTLHPPPTHTAASAIETVAASPLPPPLPRMPPAAASQGWHATTLVGANDLDNDEFRQQHLPTSRSPARCPFHKSDR